LITYSETADALYVQLQEADVTKVTPVDDSRIVDYAADGSVVGVEFLGASRGIDLRDIPEHARVEELIRNLHFSIAV
jgi:uncharacterized protein YuzE